MMRILYLGNNRVGRDVLAWLVASGEEVVGLVVHPPARARCRDEIVQAAGVGADRVFEADTLDKPGTLDALRRLAPDIGLCVYFGYILRAPLLTLPRHGCLNLHPALLPHNRGAYPNVWSIVDGTPAGVTLHRVDEGIDTGDIVAQRPVPVHAVDTGETLHRRLEDAGIALFKETWPMVRDHRVPVARQPAGAGSFHRVRDVEAIDRIDLDRTYVARDLLNLLRARTFPPYPGAYFVDGGRRVYVSVSLRYGEPAAPAPATPPAGTGPCA